MSIPGAFFLPSLRKASVHSLSVNGLGFVGFWKGGSWHTGLSSKLKFYLRKF
jgi:hypothetical protein